MGGGGGGGGGSACGMDHRVPAGFSRRARHTKSLAYQYDPPD